MSFYTSKDHEVGGELLSKLADFGFNPPGQPWVSAVAAAPVMLLNHRLQMEAARTTLKAYLRSLKPAPVFKLPSANSQYCNNCTCEGCAAKRAKVEVDFRPPKRAKVEGPPKAPSAAAGVGALQAHAPAAQGSIFQIAQ